MGDSSSAYIKDFTWRLDDSEAPIRELAALALGQLGPPAAHHAARAIARRLDDSEANVRLAAATALRWMGAPEKQATRLLPKLQDPDKRVQIAVLECFLWMDRGAAPYASTLVSFLKDPDPEVRAIVVQTFGHMFSDAAAFAEELAEMIGDKDDQVRASAITAVSRLGDAAEPYHATIQNRLRDVPQVREAAAKALGGLE